MTISGKGMAGVTTTTLLVIEHVPPPTLNELLRRHWASYRRLKWTWTLLTRNAVQWADPPRYTRASVTIRLFYPLRRRRDVDNATGGTAKLLLDALVGAGVLVDDNDAALDLRPVELYVDRAHPRVEIEIREV